MHVFTSPTRPKVIRHAILPALLLLAIVLPAQARHAYLRLAPSSPYLDAAMTTDRIAAVPEVRASKRVAPLTVAQEAPELLRWQRVDLEDTADLAATLDALRAIPGVEFVEAAPERWITALPGESSGDAPMVANLPNDPLASFQWHLDAVNAYAAWEEAADPSDVIIAILDNGVDLDHPDLAPSIWRNLAEQNGNSGFDDDGNGYIDDIKGWDTIDQDGEPDAPTDVNSPGHGTHCSGIAAAIRDNEVGGAGIAAGAQIMAVRIGEGVQIFDTAEGVLYAATNGADVISMSFAGTQESVFERDVMAYARELGVVLVAAAGNSGSSTMHYPAAYEEVIGVAGTDIENKIASFSNYGWWVQAAAPGEDILSTFINGYGYSTGTSMACPLVAGVVGLLKASHPDLDQATALAYLQQGAKPANRVNAPGTAASVVDAWRSVLGNRPALVLRDVVLNNDTDGDGRLERGESVETTFEMELIGPADSYVVSLRGGAFNSDLAVNGAYLNNSVTPGPVSISGFNIVAGSNATRGERPIALVSDVNGYRDTLSVRIPLDPPWVTMETAGMVASVADFGAIGFQDYVQHGDDYHADGIRLKDEPWGFLYHGSVMVADDNGGVADNAYGTVAGDSYDFDIINNEGFTSLSPSEGLDRKRSTFTDTFSGSVPVGVIVTQTIMADRDGADILYLNYSLKTASGTRDLTVGVFCDWDINRYQLNQVGYDADLRLSYMWGDDGYAGIMVLGSRPLAGVNAINNTSVFSGGFSDGEKWQRLTGEIDTPVSSAQGDWSHLIAQEVAAVGPTSGKLAQFAIVVADTEAELLALAAQAQGGSVAQGDGASSPEDAALPTRISLSPAWPNPFNAGTRLTLSLDGQAEVAVTVHDILGRQVAALQQGTLAAGSHALTWDGRSASGDRAAAGVYLLQATGNGLNATRKVVLVK